MTAGKIAGMAGLDEGLVHFGVVEVFDDSAGLGALRVERLGGTQLVSFHCTAIADGTRTIPQGASVACTLVTAHGGRVEASSIVAVG